MKYFLICIMPLLLCQPVFAQDKIIVYFDFGSSRIRDDQHKIMNGIPAKFDLSSLDSVRYTGFADSTGNFKANIRLSEKRAKAVSKYCKPLMPPGIPFSIMAKGEKSKKIEDRDRRVEILFFFRQELKVTQDTLKVADSPVLNCHYIAYGLLSMCHSRIISKGKKEYVLLEVGDNEFLGDLRIYYTATPAPNGGLKYQKLRWTVKTTGNLWWSKKRYQVSIPKQSFDRYKIFTISEPPCQYCHNSFGQDSSPVRVKTCYEVDKFLMDNLQVRTYPFKRKTVEIRVPAEYVDLSATYHIDYSEKTVQWQTRGGKKNRNYYFATIPMINNSEINNISRILPCCSDTGSSNGYPHHPFSCGGLRCLSPIPLSVYLETGVNYHQQTPVPYAGLLFMGEFFKSQYNILFGVDRFLGIYTNARFQYNFYTLPLMTLQPVSSWRDPSDLQTTKKILKLYAGAELRRGKLEKTYFTELNAHIGLSILPRRNSSGRFFIQYGIAHDLTGNNSAELYPIAQTGLIFQLFRF